MKLLIGTSIVVLLGLTSVASGEDLPTLPKPKPTARDLYIGCSLFVRHTDVASDGTGLSRPFSAAYCGSYSVAARALLGGRVKVGDNSRRFCLPNDAQTAQEPAQVMAYAYIDFFENRVGHMATGPGFEAYLAAMIVKWPCK
jgi:hypothetical protein